MIGKLFSVNSNCWTLKKSVLIILLMVGLASCGQNTESGGNNVTGEANATPVNEEATSERYPGEPSASDAVESEAYPPQANSIDVVMDSYPTAATAVMEDTTILSESYPALESTYATDGVRFHIEPVSASSSDVVGTAPPGILLVVADITYAGTVLGEGRSDGEGNFTIPVNNLIEGHRIGLSLVEIPPGETLESMVEQYFPYRGDNFQLVPNVGVFMETALIQP
ncbi:MAG: hypothetical protein CSA11_02920 [Chloroflexi bacterium]|nr:MAG: hypothetical protein CSA11_02920 [Chloroflexota bacterium]